MPGPGLRVLATGPLATVQDEGRPGRARLGVVRSGACDRASCRLANRLVGNAFGAPVLELTLGGLRVRAAGEVTAAITGARCPGVDHNAPLRLHDGQELSLGSPDSGLRSYLAVRGGLVVEPVLGSAATDVLSGLGPPVVAEGDEFAVGRWAGSLPDVDLAAVAEPPAGAVTVAVTAGPRRDWFTERAWRQLLREDYEASGHSNRSGIRLSGPALQRRQDAELPSEAMMRGAIQVPTSGQPVLFLADHPVTGGYPVIGYVTETDVDRCAQLRPGQRLRFRPVR